MALVAVFITLIAPMELRRLEIVAFGRCSPEVVYAETVKLVRAVLTA
jgi:hypothetical protein